jgi:predicted transcriptional regulator
MVGTRWMRHIMLFNMIIYFCSEKDMTIRNRIQIISQILETANGGVTSKLKIMYKANLSYAQLKDYLITLNDKDLLSYDLGTHTFKTTEKGLRFLEAYDQLNQLTKE